MIGSPALLQCLKRRFLGKLWTRNGACGRMQCLYVLASQELYCEGSYVVWPAFSSTTFDVKVARKFFESKKGAKAEGAMFILSTVPGGRTRGRAIHKFSAIPNEMVW